MKEKTVSVTYNFIMNIILTMSSFIFPLITFPYVSRVLLPMGTGKVAFATSVVNYFLILAQLGIPTYGIRACARVRENKDELNKTVQEILCISIIMCIIAYFLFAVILLIVPKFAEERKLLMITSVSILFTTLGVEWFFKAMEMYSYITWRSVFFKCIAIVMMFLMVKKQSDYMIYGALSIFASSASYLCNFVYLHKLINLKKRYKINIKKHMQSILVFFAMTCATTVYLNLDTTMLGFMKTDADVGYYNAAVKIKNMLVSIVTSLGAVLLPRITVYLENKEIDKFQNLSVKAFRFVFFMAVPMMVYFIFFAEQGITFLSGKEYKNAIIPMQIMMPTLLLIGLTNIMGIQILVPMGKEKKVLISVIIGAVVDLIVNLMLIPKYSICGAAIGTMLAEVMVFVYQYFSNRHMFYDLLKQVKPWKIIISTIIALLISECTLKMQVGYFGHLVLSFICFIMIYLICLLFLKESILQDIIRKK